jgi:hypothetical protein
MACRVAGEHADHSNDWCEDSSNKRFVAYDG